MNLIFNKFIIAGADSFEVLTSEYRADTRNYELNLKTPNICMDVDYTLRVKLNSSYLALKIDESKIFYLEIKPTNFHVQVTFGNLENGALIVTNIEVKEKFSPQEGIYYYGPDFQEIIDSIFVTKDTFLDKALENFLLPRINEVLSQFSTVEEMALRIKEAVGDDNTGIFGTKKC